MLGRSTSRGMRAKRQCRCLGLESLERRDLLTGELLAIRFGLADAVSHEPIVEPRVGEQFLLMVYARDLRANAAGVFGAYVDIDYPSSHLELGGPITIGFEDTTLGPIWHQPNFANGHSAILDVAGEVGEAGGFGNLGAPPGDAEQLVLAVSFVAREAGDVVISGNAADVHPEHDSLLYGLNEPVATSLIRYGTLSFHVSPANDAPRLLAVNDLLTLPANSADNRLDVLANDLFPANAQVRVADLVADRATGRPTISADGRSIVYTPARDFVGRDTFSYVIADELGNRDTGRVLIDVLSTEPTDALVEFKVDAVDRTGRELATVGVGDQFLLRTTVRDLRSPASGVFAAALDVEFDAALAAVSGPVAYGALYPNGHVGDVSSTGLLNDVGAFAGFTPLGGEALVLFSVPFTAVQAGTLIFATNPADERPQHDLLLFNLNDVVPLNKVRFDNAVLRIVNDVRAVDDTYHLTAGEPVLLPVLTNDFDRNGASPLEIRAVLTDGATGSVAIADDGRSLRYEPAAGFSGSEQFRYTVGNEHGEATAQVTIHREPESQANDVAALGLTITDLDGQPISSIAAGESFFVQTTVRDLRPAAVNAGVFAAYFDLLFPADAVAIAPAADGASRFNFHVEFGESYANGRRGTAAPGIVDELGAFQTASGPLGGDEFPLARLKFSAAGVLGQPDAFVLAEDSLALPLDVLANDLSNDREAQFLIDPSDQQPVSDVLLFDPPTVVDFTQLRFGAAHLAISGRAASIDSVTAPDHSGEVEIIDAGQRLSYRPARNFAGRESFTYTPRGGQPVLVVVEIADTPDAPHAADDFYRVRQDQPLEVAAAVGVLANDSAAAGEALTAQVVGLPRHGTVTLANDGSFAYRPNADFVGLDEFTYRVLAAPSGLASETATVRISVAQPLVSLRLDALDAAGAPLATAIAGQPFLVRSLVRDLRDESVPNRGVGAAYLDVAFDPQAARLAPKADSAFGIDIAFGDQYQNGRRVDAGQPGRLAGVGAFQTGFDPLGGDELELFRVAMIAPARAADDHFQITQNVTVNELDLLANDRQLTWEVPVRAEPANRPPITDVLLFAPPSVVDPQDVRYSGATISVRNGALQSVTVDEHSQAGGALLLVADGRVQYVAPEGFVGEDSFRYTIRDASGSTATGEVHLTVVVSWTNHAQPSDVNGDGFIANNDVLVLVNDLNANGPRELDDPAPSVRFLDVNGDGFISALDALIVINRINRERNGSAAEGESSGDDLAALPPSSVSLVTSFPPASRPAPGRRWARSISDASAATVSTVVAADQPRAAASLFATTAPEELTQDEDWADLLTVLAAARDVSVSDSR